MASQSSTEASPVPSTSSSEHDDTTFCFSEKGVCHSFKVEPETSHVSSYYSLFHGTIWFYLQGSWAKKLTDRVYNVEKLRKVNYQSVVDQNDLILHLIILLFQGKWKKKNPKRMF